MNEQTSKQQIIDSILIKMRDAISSREAATASANRELHCLGQWSCDWNAVFEQCNVEFSNLNSQLMVYL